MQVSPRLAAGVAGLATAATAAWSAFVLHDNPKSSPPSQPVAAYVATGTRKATTALFVGDSYIAGSTGVRADQSFAHDTAQTLGWVANYDAQGGTGFVADGRSLSLWNGPYASRLGRDAADYLADVIIVTGGRDDQGYPPGRVRAAEDGYLRQVRRHFPKARLVVVAPFWVDALPPPGLRSLRDDERATARSLGATFVDPLAEEWMTDRTVRYVGPDGVHPTVAGHWYVSSRLVADLRAMHVS